ncbi:MAG: O-antigen ligase family protein [Acidobacteriota bacterium]
MLFHSPLRALIPAALAGLFAGWCGTVVGGASAVGATVAYGAVLSLGALFGDWRDPLRLGRRWRWLPWLCATVVPASLWLSPVPRAGRVALILLPAFLLLPSAVARCWDSPRARRVGLIGLAWVVAGISLWAVVGRFLLGDARAARPIGHHGLMAVWLLALLPIAWRAARDCARSPSSALRWTTRSGPVLAVAALVAGGSLVGMIGLALEAAALGAVWARRRLGKTALVPGLALGLLLGVVVSAPLAPRLLDLAGGRDVSFAARQIYWQGGADGWLERPLLGWGPGATPWTLGLHLEPRAGVTPPGQVVAELHNTPLQLLYEIGFVGFSLCALLTGLLFWNARSRRPLARSGGVALAGAGVALLGTSWWAILALPVALAIAAGACLPPARPGKRRGARWAPQVAMLYLLFACLALLPGLRAHFAFSDRPEAALRLDPNFPLYLAAAAWEASGSPARAEERSLDANRAAHGAPGVAVFWLSAGVYAEEVDRQWAEWALLAACRLDPLGAMAPFHAARIAPHSPWAGRRGARALLAEPRLAAAEFWRERPGLFATARDAAIAWSGIDAGWREALRASSPAPYEEGGDIGHLAVRVDGSEEVSLSLRAFRRPAQPRWILPVPVGRRGAIGMGLPPATTLPGNDLRRAGPECSEDVTGGSEDSATAVEKAVEKSTPESGFPRGNGG